MPFLFHEKKKSIFHQKQNQKTQEMIWKENILLAKMNRNLNEFKVCVKLNTDHPFRRKIENNQQENIKLTATKQNPDGQQIKENLKRQYHERWKKIKQQIQKQKQIKKQMNQKIQSQIKELQAYKQNIIHSNQYLPPSKNKDENFQEAKKSVEILPGPGSYNISCSLITQKSPSTLITNKTNQSILTNRLDEIIVKCEQEEQLPISYKNKSSFIFKTKVCDRKLDKLKSLLFSQNKTQQQPKFQIQKQDIVQSSHPGVGQYNLISSRKYNSYLKEGFLSPKSSDFTYRLLIGNSSEKDIKQTYTKENQKVQKDTNVAFSSKVPRQLHFDNENLCRQQFWYDIDNKKLSYKNVKPFRFGSSLVRFSQLKQEKCCDIPLEEENQNSIHSKNIASFLLTEKRQIFPAIKSNSNVSPAEYKLYYHTIQKKIEKLKTKKNSQKLKHSTQNLKSQLKPEGIHIEQEEILHSGLKKQKPKKQTSFGRLPHSICICELPIRKQLDKYYNVASSMEKQSFNVEYSSKQ